MSEDKSKDQAAPMPAEGAVRGPDSAKAAVGNEDKKPAEKVVDEAKAEAPAAAAEKEQKSDTADKPKKDVPAKFKKLVEQIEQLSVVELSELVKVLEDKFGVSAAAPMMAAAPVAGSDAGSDDADEGKKEFNIVLKEAGEKKIDVIKAVREISGLGLAESKAVVDGAPKTVKENVPKDEAEAAKKKLEDAGAKADLE